MLSITLNETDGVALLEPSGKLSKDDFTQAAAIIDPFIECNGKLNGLIVHTPNFPGWDSFGALINHLKFVKNHHHQISHIALVTNSALADVAEHLTGHFIHARIKHFDYYQLEDATLWVLTDQDQ